MLIVCCRLSLRPLGERWSSPGCCAPLRFAASTLLPGPAGLRDAVERQRFFLTVMLTALLVVVAPALSVARAVSAYVPAAPLFHWVV